jgi:uncharacterized protein (TIGR02246 family)
MKPENEILELFDQWNAALGTGEPDEVVKLYATDAVLLPSFSNMVRHNHGEIRDYFALFLPRGPHSIIEQANIRVFGDTAVNSGIYVFHLASGPIKTLRARFTFVYRHVGDRWLIIEHHSSAMPEQTT